MTTVLVGVQDNKGEKIPNASVVIKDRFTGIEVGRGVTGQQGEAAISWTGTPFGTYRATATTPKGAAGTADFELDWIAASRSVVVGVPASSEGNWWSTFLSNTAAAWNSVSWLAWPIIIVSGSYLLVVHGPSVVGSVAARLEGKEERRPQ